jgi:hypothetical protein
MKLKLLKVQINKEDQNSNSDGFFTANVTTPAPESKDGTPVVVADTMKPMDIESMSLEEQAILQALADEVEKAEKSGIENPTISLTRAKVKAKLKKLKENIRKQKRMKTMN